MDIKINEAQNIAKKFLSVKKIHFRKTDIV